MKAPFWHRHKPVHFPGRNEWRWHLQLQAERLASPLRMASILAFLALWFGLTPARRLPPEPVLVLLLAALFAYAIVDFLVLRFRPRVVSGFPYGSVLLDFLFAVALTTASGGARSPILPVLFLGMASAAIRLSTVPGLVITGLYTLAAGLLAPADPYLAASLLLLGVSLTLWGAHIHEDRIEHLRDPLTGAFTRAYALFHLERLLEQRKTFSIGLVDLDHFKAVNDKVGHVAGDAVLQQYVHRIQSGLRAGDLLSRYGGDELLIVFEGIPLAEALPIAERLRSSIADQSIRLPDSQETVAITVSIGVIEALPGMRTPELLRHVDRCLYQSKRMRNEVSAC
jgi:diguanylate cyclase (GGDEF)-like protein